MRPCEIILTDKNFYLLQIIDFIAFMFTIRLAIACIKNVVHNSSHQITTAVKNSAVSGVDLISAPIRLFSSGFFRFQD